MDIIYFKDIILLTVGFLLSVIGGLIGAKIQRIFDKSREQRPLNKIFNFGKGELLFVFPHREEISEAILPRTSTEDFLAMNNIISALISAGFNQPIRFRDTTHIDANDLKKNLVIICSPRSNRIANILQEEIEKKQLPIYKFKNEGISQWCIADGYTEYKSKSYQQKEQYLQSGCDPHDLPEKTFDDFAVITKVTNPWNDDSKVIWIAGLRGIGTWGAGECLKKQWKIIYNSLPTDSKENDFSAILAIKYNNCDITSINVLHVKNFDSQ